MKYPFLIVLSILVFLLCSPGKIVKSDNLCNQFQEDYPIPIITDFIISDSKMNQFTNIEFSQKANKAIYSICQNILSAKGYSVFHLNANFMAGFIEGLNQITCIDSRISKPVSKKLPIIMDTTNIDTAFVNNLSQIEKKLRELSLYHITKKNKMNLMKIDPKTCSQIIPIIGKSRYVILVIGEGRYLELEAQVLKETMLFTGLALQNVTSAALAFSIPNAKMKSTFALIDLREHEILWMNSTISECDIMEKDLGDADFQYDVYLLNKFPNKGKCCK